MGVTKSLTAKEVCDIIESCKGGGVSTLKYGTLNIQFYSTDPYLQLNNQLLNVNESSLASQVEAESLLDDEIDVKDSQLSELLITDPEQYEKLLAQGELENANRKHRDS